ncbi:hypothetical protein C8R44DRAFT_746184 [Mycena epipterygia]|nr:hypothetical protein C8R44DRAFT_746184 [Mycena epipterygia]
MTRAFNRSSPDVWFDDGTLVLQAETTLFRVYLLADSALVTHSAFKSNQYIVSPQSYVQLLPEGTRRCVYIHAVLEFGVASPQTSAYFFTIDLDLALAHLKSQSYSIAASFLPRPPSSATPAIFLQRTGFWAPHFVHSFAAQHKYHVEHIRGRMVSILTALYPSTSSAFLGRQVPAGYVEMDRDDFIALKLAVDYDIRVALPDTLYRCCRHSVAELFDAEISFEDKKRCTMAIHGFTTDLRPLPSRIQWDGMRLDWIEKRGLRHFNEVFEGEFNWDSLYICGTCSAAAELDFRLQLQVLWDNLPIMFQLLAWPVLKGQSKAAFPIL